MQNDSSSRFIMERADVRGYMLQLNRTLTESLSASDYPAPIRSLLGEFNPATNAGFAASRDLNPWMILAPWILNTCLPAAHWL